jgi:hypothetical protein
MINDKRKSLQFEIEYDARKESKTKKLIFFCGSLGEAYNKARLFCNQKYGVQWYEIILVKRIK